MKPYQRYTIGAIILLCIVAVTAKILITPITNCELEVSNCDFKLPPTIYELQEFLCAEGYEVKVDGKLGAETYQALKDWYVLSEAEWMNEQAAKHF